MNSLKRSDIYLRLIRPLGFIWMKFDTKTRMISNVNFKRKDPFLLLGNHVYHYDVVQLALHFKKTPAIVGSETLLSTPYLGWLLKNVAKVIPKSKGTSDARTIRQIYEYVKKGYPVMIMPEGDTTFFGETGYIEEATAKLIKKLKIDVLIGITRGGYVSGPRWAKAKRKNRSIELEYQTLFTKDEIEHLTTDQIYAALTKALYHNDYEYQRKQMIPHPSKALAEGLENVIYVCSECNQIHTIVTEHNEIRCTSCGAVGKVDDYGFIQGLTYDNLIDWNDHQRQFDAKLKQMTFRSTAKLIHVDNVQFKRSKPIDVQIAYQDGVISIKGKEVLSIPVHEMITPIITLRRNFSFQYQNKEYIVKIDSFALSFLRVAQEKY